jgi:hypothetical protein
MSFGENGGTKPNRAEVTPGRGHRAVSLSPEVRRVPTTSPIGICAALVLQTTCTPESVCGPTLPSAASAGHGGYLGVSCRQRRWSTTAEDDPELPSTAPAFCNALAL